MKVFLTGGTGALGRFLVPRLVGAGHDVTALARSDDKAASIAAAGATPARVDLFDGDGLRAAVAGHDVVANMATSIPPVTQAWRAGAWEANDRIRREASGLLVDAAIAAGASRFVQESITFIYEDGADRWLDERTPIEPVNLDSTTVAEAAAARFTASGPGRAGVVLRFGLFYGPGSAHSETFVTAARHGVGPATGRSTGYVSSIHLADAAAAVVAALDDRVAAGTYNVVDDEPVTKRAYAEVLGRAVGKRPRVLSPGRLSKVGGSRTAPLARSHRVANGAFKAASGWAPQYPSVETGWPATVRAMTDSAAAAEPDGQTAATDGSDVHD
jgi:nucleoside-diphosphate-sugar epimerase